MENEKKTTLGGVIDAAMDKVRAMADANTIVGQPIQTADGVTLIPISKVSMGFGGGGTDYGSAQTKDLSGGLGGGVKIDPVAFLVVKDGVTRVMPVAMPPVSAMDRLVEMAPDLMDKVEKYFDKKEAKETL